MAQKKPTLDRIVDGVGELVRIPSVNPLQAGPRSGDTDERAVAEWVANRAEALGANVTLDEVLGGRSNVYARFEGTSEREVTVDVHLDTVGVEHMTRDPFDGVVEDGRVFGRGSVDTKATFAVLLAVLEDLRAVGAPLVPNLNLVGTVSEEVGGLLGAARHAEWLAERTETVDQMVVAEPTMCAPVFGHKGGLGLDITIAGEAAHSSKPHLGQNAIHAAARVVSALSAEHDRLADLGGTTEVGAGTLAVTDIGGGLARNIIPDCCKVYGDRRLVPGEQPDAIFADLTRLIEEAAHPLSVEVETPYGEGFAAFYEDPNGALITLFANLAASEPETASYGSNALMYGTAAREVMVFGPGSIDQAHKAVEWVDITELERAADIYRRFLTAV